jgi:hypothetical protein
MTPHKAMALVLGMRPIEDEEDAFKVIQFFEEHPEHLTNGQACRGLETLRAMFGCDTEE